MTTVKIDTFICPSCGEYEDAGRAYTRKHIFAGAEVTHMVCYWCSDQEPCTGTFSGVHFEIEDIDDLIERFNLSHYYVGSTVRIIDWAALQDTLPAWVHECLPLSQSMFGRIGRCTLCLEWQVWDVHNQSWRDPEIIP